MTHPLWRKKGNLCISTHTTHTNKQQTRPHKVSTYPGRLVNVNVYETHWRRKKGGRGINLRHNCCISHHCIKLHLKCLKVRQENKLQFLPSEMFWGCITSPQLQTCLKSLGAFWSAHPLPVPKNRKMFFPPILQYPSITKEGRRQKRQSNLALFAREDKDHFW